MENVNWSILSMQLRIPPEIQDSQWSISPVIPAENGGANHH